VKITHYVCCNLFEIDEKVDGAEDKAANDAGANQNDLLKTMMMVNDDDHPVEDNLAQA
jgi:hypothetical protein